MDGHEPKVKSGELQRMYIRLARFYLRKSKISAVKRILRKLESGTRTPTTSYELGLISTRAKDYATAERFFVEALEGDPTQHEWWYRYAVVLERKKKYSAARSNIERAIELSPTKSEYRYRRGVCSLLIGDKPNALDDFEAALSLNSDDLRPIFRIPAALSNETPLWRRQAVLRSAAKIGGNNFDILVNLGRAAYWMRNFRESRWAYSEAIRAGNLSSKDLYQYSYALKYLGEDHSTATSSVMQIVNANARTPREIGQIHAEHKNTDDALDAEIEEWVKGSEYGGRSFRIGRLYEQKWMWDEARLWFVRAISIDPFHAYWFYKAGLNCERVGDLRGAVQYFSLAIDLSSEPNLYWYYRIGHCYLKMGLGSRAYKFFIMSYDDRRILDSAFDVESEDSGFEEITLKSYTQIAIGDSEILYRAGLREFKARNIERALHLFSKYLERTEPRKHENIQNIARLFAANGTLKKALDLLIDSRRFSEPDGIDVKKLTKHTYDSRVAIYLEYMTRLPVEDETILYESYWGTTLSCNPFAIYLESKRHSILSNYKHIWVYQDCKSIPAELYQDSKVVLVKYGTDSYFRYLATSKFLINNATFVPFFVKRREQVYVNTWHGTPLKTLGRSTQFSIVDDANTVRNLTQASVVAAPNSYTAEILVHDFDIGERDAGKVVTVGSPRLDRLVENEGRDRNAIRAKLGLESDDHRKLIFYAPTWRGTNKSRELDVGALQADLDAMDGVCESSLVIFRGHHLTESQLTGTPLEGRIVPKDVDTYEILEVADVLVSDYSSLLFDFMATGRPVVAYTSDEEEFRSSRGLYLRLDDVFGYVARSRAELVEKIGAALDPPKAFKVPEIARRILEPEDGLAGSRVIDVMLEHLNPSEQRKTDAGRRRVVIGVFASLLPNGITAALRDLINGLDSELVDIIVFADAHNANNSPVDEFVAGLNKSVRVYCRHVSPVFTLAERVAFDEFKRARKFHSPEHRRLVRTGFTRELKRMVGDTHIDVLLQYEGYASYWTGLFACADSIGARSILFLHNQMEHEVETKYPYLREIFSWLVDYDVVASVSESVARLNHSYLMGEGYLSEDSKMEWFRNPISVERTRTMATEAPANQPLDASPCMLAIGRLSPEKNHQLLIEMLPLLIRLYPKTRLRILGDGPLRSYLESLAASLGVATYVEFCGQVANPYPEIQNADILLLPSLHEGQPVVMYEAAALGVPFVAAPTPGISEVAGQLGGEVAAAEPSRFAEAIINMLENKPAAASTLDSLNASSFIKFYSLVGVEFRR
ncbi:CDP-glycerol glycerophosphotransferase family protein [Brevibacterium aurantiacum]|uniref:CDP-glycerol glycerophosphotransferase family protein n=1 Tax=Brevibacterium aurantiacum TaxID=273384 RepID=UPI0018679084|nr:CDP-glycerol glycerophosphotransferase family protein [Brevibacterium aurantiacum]